ncbi:hypothetical protein [Deinococcus rubellus]|uniref:hypothetical protein n=1 Tax=Deinococcus rubellus TaxID=1889240 RepID=UPI0031F023AC
MWRGLYQTRDHGEQNGSSEDESVCQSAAVSLSVHHHSMEWPGVQIALAPDVALRMARMAQQLARALGVVAPCWTAAP